MLILAADTSSKYCSAAVYRDGEIVSDLSVNNGKTHSQVFMPMVEQALSLCGAELSQVDAFACTVGPGSFTGVRIAVAAVKALSQAMGKPCVAVNTLRAAAYNISDAGALVCPILDARCGQVYAAVYDGVREVYPVSALALEELCDYLYAEGRSVIFTGDGVSAHRERIMARLGEAARFAPPHLGYQRAAAAAVIGAEELAAGRTVGYAELEALYLRKPQAEREYEARHGI